MSRRGEFEARRLLDAVQIVAACGKTGSIVVTTRLGQGAIGFDRGRAVCAFSWGSLPPDPRARILTAEGKPAYLRGRILFPFPDLRPPRKTAFASRLSSSP